MTVTLQLLLIPVALPVAYAIGWCLPHLWQDAIFWRLLGPEANTHWWLRRHISNYRCLQWRHALRHPLSPYPDLTP